MSRVTTSCPYAKAVAAIMRSSTGSRLPAADKAASVLAKILAAASSKTKIGKVWRTFST